MYNPEKQPKFIGGRVREIRTLAVIQKKRRAKESQHANVNPSPATHAILTLLQAGETYFRSFYCQNLRNSVSTT